MYIYVYESDMTTCFSEYVCDYQNPVSIEPKSSCNKVYVSEETMVKNVLEIALLGVNIFETDINPLLAYCDGTLNMVKTLCSDQAKTVNYNSVRNNYDKLLNGTLDDLKKFMKQNKMKDLSYLNDESDDEELFNFKEVRQKRK